MANRLFGNVIIVDSAMGNLSIFGSTDNLTNYHVSGFAFWYGDTSGAITFTEANTADTIIKFSLITVATGNQGISMMSALDAMAFSPPLHFNQIKVPSLTSGTGWIYLA